MAYFIVIGTNNDVKSVVDEVKRAHLQHNVVTSGCIVREDRDLYYHWDIFNKEGEKNKENKDSIELHDALTNQISQFRTLLPTYDIPNVFIISKCFNEEECKALQMVCDELYNIGGATFGGLRVDIILLGYDLNKPDNVAIRPHWRILKTIRGLGERARFDTNILYINNIDYMGAATNVDSHVLGRFLSNWSKMVSSSGFAPKATVQSHVYSIGMSEHQYDFRDLNEFFKLSAEEILLDRTLNNSPSSDTQELIDSNDCKKIDLDKPWLDGLCTIHSIWDKYCSTQWDPSKPLSENEYSISQQELRIASYLNSFLKLYIKEEQREIEIIRANVAQKEIKRNERADNLTKLSGLSNDEEENASQIDSLNEEIAQLDSEIDVLMSQIAQHERNIANNTFFDADTFNVKFGTMDLLTEEDETTYTTNKQNVEHLIDYVKSDAGINIMREAIKRATSQDVLPDSCPESEVLNIGRLNNISRTKESDSLEIQPSENSLNTEKQSEKTGCLFGITNLFRRNKTEENDVEIESLDAAQSDIIEPIEPETVKSLYDNLSKSVAAIKKADDVHRWWNQLSDIIEKDQKRQSECKLMMDGEKDDNGEYTPGHEGYRPNNHRKSTSLIDMERVRSFRDTDSYYKQNIDKFLNRWFDKTIDMDKRITMPELIKHQVLDPLVGRFHTLHWDGSNPFVKEDITDEEMHAYIEQDISESKPFVEYVRIQETNLVSNLNILFYSNNPNIPVKVEEFRSRYHVGANSIQPVFLEDYVNSLCVVQIIDIPDHVEALKDFMPKRETPLSRLRTDISDVVSTIIGDTNANTVEEKARVIYDWICENIAYDTTKQIHDAETCYRTRRGVCQAYCELFCYMAESVGVTADIITGVTKDSKGKITEDKHAWIYVYTHAYEGMFIDPTWGAGSVTEKGEFIKSKDSLIWFDIQPAWMAYTHFPDNNEWLKLDVPITEEVFKKLPYKEPNPDNGFDQLIKDITNLN